MECRNADSAYSSANMTKSEDCTDYDAVIKQFDDLIVELSNSNAVKDNVSQSDNLLDIIQEDTAVAANTKENVFEISMNNSSNVPECFSRKFYSNLSTQANLVLPRNEFDSATQSMLILGMEHSKPSTAIANSQKMKENISESGGDIPWINSHLWHTEKNYHQGKKSTSSKTEKNTSFSGNSIKPNKIDVPFAKNVANISEHGYNFNRNISYTDRLIYHHINYPENKRIKRHQPSSYSENFMMSGFYDPKLEFHKELAVKCRMQTSGSCVTMSPRMHRPSSTFRCISSDSCFMVKLFIETKNSHLGPFTFEIYPKMSLRLLKLKVEKEYGIISSSQRWILGKTFAVDNDKSLVDYDVMPKSPIILYVDNKHTIFSDKIENEEYNFDNGIQLNDVSETIKYLEDGGINYLVDSQTNQYSEAGTDNRFDSLDLKHVSKPETGNLHLNEHFNNLSNDTLANEEKSYDLSNVRKSPASKKKFKGTLLLKNSEVKDSDTLKLNVKNEKEFELKNVFEKDLRSDGLDEILPKEKTSNNEEIKDKQNSVNDKLTYSEQFCTQSSVLQYPCNKKEVLHPCVYSSTFTPSSNLKVQEKKKSLHSGSSNMERYFSHDEIGIKHENIDIWNLDASERKFEFKNIFEKDLKNEGLDEILPKEKISNNEGIKDKQNSVNDKLTYSEQFCTQSSVLQSPCSEKGVLHSCVYSSTFTPSSNLKVQEKKNSLLSGSPNVKRHFSHDEIEVKSESIDTGNHDASKRKVELKNLELVKDFEKNILSSSNLPAKFEKTKNLHEAISPGVNKATSSKGSLTSILRKLSLTRKTNSKDDANSDNDFSNVDIENITDNKSSDPTSLPPDQTFTDIHIEISCSSKNVQAENEYNENSNNNFQVENPAVENLEAVKNFELLQEIENTDLVQNTMKFSCPVCFDDFDSGQGAVLHDCLHIFCRNCLINSVIHAEGALVKCPYRDDFYSCESYLQQREIKALVSEEVYEKYLQRSIMTAEGLADRSFHCKTPNCPGWCIYDNAINVFHCPVCFHYNCLNCQDIHEGLNCRQYQSKLKEQQKVDENAMKTLDLLNRMIEDGKALKCPKCELILMKKWGCDWLKCSICKTEICWITRGPRWGPGGQGDTSGGCRCGVNGIKCHPSCTYCH